MGYQLPLCIFLSFNVFGLKHPSTPPAQVLVKLAPLEAYFPQVQAISDDYIDQVNFVENIPEKYVG